MLIVACQSHRLAMENKHVLGLCCAAVYLDQLLGVAAGHSMPKELASAWHGSISSANTLFTAVALLLSQGKGFSSERNFTTPPAAGSASSSTPLRLLAAAELGTFSADGAEVASAAHTRLHYSTFGHLAVPGSHEFTLLKAALLATGQYGPSPASKTTQQQMLRTVQVQQHHALLVPGGLSMAAGQSLLWDDFLDQMEPLLSQVPLAAAPSETESADPLLRSQAFNSRASGGECGVPYESLLRMPHAAKFDQWYATQLGPVHLVMMSTEQNLAPGSAQYK